MSHRHRMRKVSHSIAWALCERNSSPGSWAMASCVRLRSGSRRSGLLTPETPSLRLRGTTLPPQLSR